MGDRQRREEETVGRKGGQTGERGRQGRQWERQEGERETGRERGRQ